MDKSIDPRQDFYRYAVGNWLKNNPVPPDKSSWGAFDELREWNLRLLREIAEDCAKKVAIKGSAEQLVGDFYKSGFTKNRESAKFGVIEDLWELALSLSTKRELAERVAKLHKAGVRVFFSCFSRADKKNSSVYALYLVQGGLSLPDRDYYLKHAFSELKKEYKAHVQRMFELKGLPQVEARNYALKVVELETKLASSSRTRAELRDQERNYNRFELSMLSRYSTLDFESYFDALGIRADYAIVGQPEFFDALNKIEDLEGVRAYLAWHVLHSYAPFLHREVEKEHFEFFQRKLLGQQKQEARWKSVIETIDESIGEALGKLYVERYFPKEAREKMEQLVRDLLSVFRDRLLTLSWMSEATRKEALKKFERLRIKIGHPEKFRDYTGLEISPSDYAGNVRRSIEFEVKRQMLRVGKEVDRSEWFMTPPTVNAYFSPTDNEIVFPAGILQPPFFDFKADDAVNYGAIGAVIGHEITHGYDDQGRRFDHEGNLRDWWTPEDAKEFGKRAAAVVKLYSSQEVLPGFFINGELTLGENIADIGGLSIAYEALQRRLKKESRKRLIDGLTQEQRFFISYAQIWRQNIKEEELKRRLTIDPHSPARYRATLPAVNHPAFDLAFPSNEKTEKPRIQIW